MTRKKPISERPEKDALPREDQRLLEALAEYLADLAAEEHLRQTSKKREGV